MKYKLTKETKEYLGRTLYQIEATENFGNIKKGDKGGYIEKEENLSQEDNAWVYGNARVYDNARVHGDAEVYGNAWVSGDAEVYGNARVYGNAWVYGNARVYDNARVHGDAWVYEGAWKAGHIFAREHGDWKVTEVDQGDGWKLLVRDYEKSEKKHTITIDGKEIEISDESFNNLKEQLTERD